MEADIIPTHISGKQNDLSETHTFTDLVAARKCFDAIKDDLLHPHRWSGLTGGTGAAFGLFTQSGDPITRSVDRGDLLRIDLPGPGSLAGGGYDWVCVEDIQSREDITASKYLFAILVRPCRAPQSNGTDTAHFFTPEATSTFAVELDGTVVTVSYHGRNETPNSGAANMIDKVRNTVTGMLAIAGVSELQWTALLKGLLAGNK